MFYMVTMQKCREHSSLVVVTEETPAAHREQVALARLARPLGDSDGDASCRSSSVGDVASSRGAAVHAVMTYDRLSPS